MLFVETLKPLKIYRRPLYLPTVEGDKKKKSAIFLLTPNYESSKGLITSPLLINKLRFQSYYIEKDLTYFISSKVMNKVDDVTETYVRDYSEIDFYQSLCEMSAAERNKLKDSDFGLPKKRKYPLNDKAHVKSAIKFFNYVDKEDEAELAKNLNKAINKYYGKDDRPKVGDSNRFKKYYHEYVVMEATKYENSFKSDKELYEWMKQVDYKSNGVYDTSKIERDKAGDCHDQAGYLYYQLKKMGYKAGRLFMIEYHDGGIEGGKTHTACWYIKKNKYYWIETAWYGMEGIHECKDLKNMRDYIFKNWKFSGKHDRLMFDTVRGVKDGMSLGEYVGCCVPKNGEPKHSYEKGMIIKESVLNEVQEIPIEKEYHIFDNDGTDNACVIVPGISTPLRGRSEVLIIKDDMIYLDFKSKDDKYRVPGGSWEESDTDHMMSAIREAKEEARIVVKNPKWCGNYIETFDAPPKWVTKTFPKEYWWYGYYTELYVGEYDKKYTGKVAKVDQDTMSKNGKFYLISEVYDKLIKPHKEALSVSLTEADLDLCTIRFWHMERARSGYDPYNGPLYNIVPTQYFNSIDRAIKEINLELDPGYHDTIYAYTMGNDNAPVYVGKITVYRTTNGKIDWEWEERSNIPDNTLAYYRDSIQKVCEPLE